MSHRKYKLFHGLGRYRGVEKRAQSQPSKKVFWKGWWAVSESMQRNWIEWKSGVWGEGHIWDIPTWAVVDSKGQPWESLLAVILSDISPKSAAWGGSQKMRREESGELAAFARFPFLCLWQSQKCKGDKVFLVLPVLQQGSRTKQSDFWLMHVLRFPLSETHSLWVLAGFLFVIWSCFLQVFSMIFLVLYVQPVMCKFSVQTK